MRRQGENLSGRRRAVEPGELRGKRSGFPSAGMTVSTEGLKAFR